MIDEKVWWPACNVLMEWEEYREHAKKEFGNIKQFTKCCNSENIEFDNNGRLRCGVCWKFTKTYKKFIEYIVPQRTKRRDIK